MAMCGLLLVALAWPAHAQRLAPIPALDSPVIDSTGTLDAATRAELERQALALQTRKGSQLQVLMVPTTQPEDIAQYAQRVFDQWKLGRQGVDDGVLLIVAKDDRRVRIQPGYGLEGAIPDATANRVIQEYLVPQFRNGNFAGGIVDATGQLVRLIDGEPLPAPVSTHRPAPDNAGNWMMALFFAFAAANVLRGVFGRLPAGARALASGGGAGLIAWVISSALLVGGVGAAIGFFIGLLGAGGGGRYARDNDWGGWGGGGGGWSGGGSGGGSWSGGGGSSGGGGASGSW
ncbi:YgcG family protein [Lysobacter pythonis]|uniref:YgcG family protein n=2 Tax=Solilutibacter pythonis TaxID=2483112 RepID=A0A3M2I4X8_9GAMM|nr:TPM domain-containing protein [Lysobacter pythonis]RMH93527.1 YgcG family protein [Lysobacter pythonis]